MRPNYKLTDLAPVFQMDALNQQAERDYKVSEGWAWLVIFTLASLILALAFWPELEGLLP